ncbi:hypothetical protein ABZ642_17915 [Streptomyces sp. NPDC007157]|uniref:hypothetical protein n=1 Tax=Streptomyces sp. NPDC007157 TaxID=3154681 RepID=UPI0033CD1F50
MVLLALAGCTTTTSTGERATASETPAGTASSSEPSATASATGDPRIPPQLVDAQKKFVKSGGNTGSRSFPVIAEIRKGTLEVAVICSGTGTVDFKVGSVADFTTGCADGDPGQYDEVALDHDYRNVVVSVTSRTAGSWGLSVGWTKVVNPPA